MSYNARRIVTPGPSRKRKEREVFYSATSPRSLAPVTSVSGSVQATTSQAAVQPPLSSNRLLAGYMAHEFLNKGTLFGQKFDPARAEAVPVSSADPKRSKQSQSQAQMYTEAEPTGKPKPKPNPNPNPTPNGYAEVAHLLKSDGAHIPGVVNPTQLGRWLQL
ncbi:uncharacterized protein LOC127249236 [Andrographis paniculata]|uniref:uncharacterized protein LOC127249236 n=1 Tax=Andrographis paniculata TaxID=175694 RepID=UPI0021E8CD28|nr:uncharacterized protein LOC127249236 [Andrographis paniculata]